MNLTLVLQGLIKVFGAAALLLGLAFWLGYARPLTQLHVGLGIGLVLCVWAVSWIAWRNGRAGLAAFGLICGALSWILGVTQGAIAPGPYHWVVEAAHLAVGAITVVAGIRIAAAVSLRGVSARASS